MPLLRDRRTAGNPDPAEILTDTIGSRTFRASRRTFAHLRATDEAVRAQRIGCFLRVIQGCYNSSVPASAGTHDYDGCLDVEIVGMGWAEAQTLLRRLGWAAWYRPYTPGLWGAHVHMVSLGCPGPVGIYVQGQVDDYYAHRTGLKGHAADPTWHPADIDSTVFDYPAWIEELDMPAPKDWDAADWAAMQKNLGPSIAKSVWGLAVDGGKLTALKVMGRLGKAFDNEGKPKR